MELNLKCYIASGLRSGGQEHIMARRHPWTGDALLISNDNERRFSKIKM